MITNKVIATGPVLNGAALWMAEALVDACKQELADYAKQEVDLNLAASLQFPTGFYQSQIEIISRDRDLVVDDSFVIYGPWLEGVGSRNRTTVFKGYFSFRRAYDAVVAAVAFRVQPLVNLYAGRMNGDK